SSMRAVVGSVPGRRPMPHNDEWREIHMQRHRSTGTAACLVTVCLALGWPVQARAQTAEPSDPSAAPATAAPQPTSPPKPTFDIYGFAMLDMGHNFTQIHPDWYDTLRVTKLPSVKDEFGKDNSTFAGVRQSRLGFKSSTPTDYGDVKTTFEFELFGTGGDAGQTTFR